MIWAEALTALLHCGPASGSMLPGNLWTSLLLNRWLAAHGFHYMNSASAQLHTGERVLTVAGFCSYRTFGDISVYSDVFTVDSPGGVRYSRDGDLVATTREGCSVRPVVTAASQWTCSAVCARDGPFSLTREVMMFVRTCPHGRRILSFTHGINAHAVDAFAKRHMTCFVPDPCHA